MSVVSGLVRLFALPVVSIMGATILVGVNAPPAWSGETITNTVRKALKNSYSFEAKRHFHEAKRHEVTRAKARFLPTVQGELYAQDRNNSGSASDNSNSLDLSLSMPLFRGGRNYFGYKAAKSNKRAALWELVDAGQQVILAAVDAHLAVVRERKTAALRAENVTRLRRLLTTARKRYKAGDASRTDIAETKAQLEFGKAELVSAKATLQNAEREYYRLTQSMPGRLVGGGVVTSLPRSKMAARNIALRSNPSVHAANNYANAARYNARGAVGAHLPSVDLEMGSRWEDPTGIDFDQESENYVGLRVNVPLFAPETVASVRQSRSEAQQRYYEALDARRNLLSTVDQAWTELKSANQREAILKQRITSARNAVTGARKAYKAGLKSITEVLISQDLYVRARIDHATAQYEKVFSQYQLLAISGILAKRYASAPRR